jgi:hypothetical protein
MLLATGRIRPSNRSGNSSCSHCSNRLGSRDHTLYAIAQFANEITPRKTRSSSTDSIQRIPPGSGRSLTHSERSRWYREESSATNFPQAQLEPVDLQVRCAQPRAAKNSARWPARDYPRLLSFRKVPSWSSVNACCSCSCVFITIGPYHATGSSSGFPETSRKRIPSSPA